MPITIPPFVQYQAPLVPLRGVWNLTPPEGDRFVTGEVQWGLTTGQAMAVQFQLGGNSPVALSQIAAFNVDNTRCGSDVTFIFPDSGSALQIPAYNQGLYPVFTNALTFYAWADKASVGDITIFQVLNTIPPPVAVQPTQEQNVSTHIALPMNLNQTNTIIASPANGTLEAFQFLMTTDPAATPSSANLQLRDGDGRTLWLNWTGNPTTGAWLNAPTMVLGLRQRFFDGLFLVVYNSNIAAGTTAIINVYYAVP